MWNRILAVLLIGAVDAAASPASLPDARCVPAVSAPAPSPATAVCGNYRCEPPEDCRSCPQDCGRCCGNYRCEPPEDCNSCPQDCGRCP